tara:strand:+ start:2993 stop:3481 length:489 start_codon:yes stop_codon:yes gene_type:complete
MTFRKINSGLRDEITALLHLQSAEHWRKFENKMGTHPPTVRDVLEVEMHIDQHQIKLQAVCALQQHDFIDTLATELAKGIALMQDMAWWDSHGFNGFTEHTLKVAGMARALSEAMSISQDVNERDAELPDNDTPVEPPAPRDPDLTRQLVAETITQIENQET